MEGEIPTSYDSNQSIPHRKLHNISVQTGEEFSMEFLQDRVTPKAFQPRSNIDPSYNNFNPKLYVKDKSPPNGIKFNENSLEAKYDHSTSVKLKFICSFGGKILPRPGDGKLRYVGGEKRIISIKKRNSLSELMQKTLTICKQPHTIKYQLPGEDLDALISVTSDEDLQNMIEEYYGLEKADGSPRIRIFLITTNELDGSSIDTIGLHNNSDYHYVAAVNNILDSNPTNGSSANGSPSYFKDSSHFQFNPHIAPNASSLLNGKENESYQKQSYEDHFVTDQSFENYYRGDVEEPNNSPGIQFHNQKFVRTDKPNIQDRGFHSEMAHRQQGELSNGISNDSIHLYQGIAHAYSDPLIQEQVLIDASKETRASQIPCQSAFRYHRDEVIDEFDSGSHDLHLQHNLVGDVLQLIDEKATAPPQYNNMCPNGVPEALHSYIPTSSLTVPNSYSDAPKDNSCGDVMAFSPTVSWPKDSSSQNKEKDSNIVRSSRNLAYTSSDDPLSYLPSSIMSQNQEKDEFLRHGVSLLDQDIYMQSKLSVRENSDNNLMVEDVTDDVPHGVRESPHIIPVVHESLDNSSPEVHYAESNGPGSGCEDAAESEMEEPFTDAATAVKEASTYGLQIINNVDVEEIRELGSGTFGTVYYGKWRGTDVAIKRIKKSCFSGRASEQDRLTKDFWREAQILSKLHHPNVVAFYGVVPDGTGGTLATVTEFMVNGSLRHVLLRKDRYLDRRKRLLIAMDAAFGMEYLHSKNIVHFDLKCDNLLVNLRDSQRPICKVGDFGLSRIKRNTMVSGGVRGTLPWMAPELLNGTSNRVSEKVDVFSFGIAMWEILTGEEPYANMHCGAIIGGIMNNTLRPQIPENCDPEWKKLMEQCWSSDPSARPSFTEITHRLRTISASLQPKTHSNLNR